MRQVPWRLVIAASFGSGLEYYAYILFVLLAKPLALNFFPADHPDIAFLKTLAIFAVSYLTMPIGALIFGQLGDRLGRRFVFLTALWLMMGATALMGVLPSFTQFGVISPVLLVLCRLLQGMSAGGEISGSMVLVAEHAGAQKRGFHCGLMFMGVGIGASIATGIVSLLHACLTTQQLMQWGWRLPFLLSIVFGVVGYYLRRTVEESPVFSQVAQITQHSYQVLSTVLKSAKSRLCKGAGLVIYGASMVTLGLLLPHICHQLFGYPLHQVLLALTIGFSTNAFLQPFFGALSDRFGRKRTLLTAIVVTACLMPLGFWWLSFGSFLALFIVIWGYYCCLTAIAASYVPFLTEIFPVSYRVSGAGMAYMGAFSLAGFVPFLSGWLLHMRLGIAGIIGLLSVIAVISFVTALTV